MIKIDNSFVSQQEEILAEMYKISAKAPLYHEDVIKEVLPRLYEQWGVTYPQEIKIVPTKDNLRLGKMEPSRVLKIDKPIMSKRYGVPMWFGNSKDGVQLVGVGYKNGDKRFPCTVTLSDKDIHMFLGGATGHGKSVTLNSMIFLLCYIYPPWELKFIMSDAKVVEFSKYMGGAIPPHIRSISAATDPDYILSLLETYLEEMQFYNSVFSKYNKSGNIMEFREHTGFAMERSLVIIDEVTATLDYGANKAAKIEKNVALYGKLGRNTGYNLVLSSQDASKMTGGIMTHIKVRAALGCEQAVSDKILNNEEASLYYGEKGRMIINTEPTKKSTEQNVHFRVPFLHPTEMGFQMEELEEMGKEIGWYIKPTLYNETEYLDESQYLEALAKAPLKPNTVYLGEPSFVYTDADETGMLRMELHGKDNDNLVILGNQSSATTRYVKLVLENVKRFHPVSNSFTYIINADGVLREAIDLESYSDLCWNIRSIDDDAYKNLKASFLDRLLVISADEKVFTSNVRINPAVKSVMESYGGVKKEWITNVNMQRITAMVEIMRRAPFVNHRVPAGAKDDVLIENALESLYTHESIGTISGEQATKNKFRKMYAFLLGFNKINALGVGSAQPERTFFKAFLMESSLVNMHVTVSSFDTEDMGEYKNSFRYLLFDKSVPEPWARMLGRSSVPDVADVLAFMKDRTMTDEDPLRFKKFAMEGESFV